MGKTVQYTKKFLYRTSPFVYQCLTELVAQFVPIQRPGFDPSPGARRLLIDVSQTSTAEFLTGIQRVVRHLVAELRTISEDIEIVPVVLARGVPFRLVRAVAFERSLGLSVPPDDAMLIRQGDTLLMLDATWGLYFCFRKAVFPVIREHGGRVIACVYDLIPITHPQFFHPLLVRAFVRWYNAVVKDVDGVVAISSATADEVMRSGYRGPIASFHLGSDFNKGRIQNRKLSDTLTVLSVSTIEPRKGYDVILDAFETLWRAGSDTRWRIVGRQGWLVDALVDRIRSHPEFGKRLIWNDKADDAALMKAYDEADLVLSASHAEGFGLPIVEAAALGKPALLSDIPSHREICGNSAIYFTPGDANDLATKLRCFDLMRQAPVPPEVLKWKQSAKGLLAALDRLHRGYAQSVGAVRPIGR